MKGDEVSRAGKPQLENSVSWGELPREQYFWAFCYLKTGFVPPVRVHKFSQAGVAMVTSGCGVGEPEASLNPPGRQVMPLKRFSIVTLGHRDIFRVRFSSSAHCLWYLNERPHESHLDFNFHHEKEN